VNRRRANRGVTLVEMLVVVAIIATMAGLVYPAVASGLETLRLNQAAGQVVSLFNEGLIRAERRQQVVEVSIAMKERTLALHSTEQGFERKVELPEGVRIASIRPEPVIPDPENRPRQFILYPGGAPPSIAVELVNMRRSRRIVRLDPITGSPRIERPEN